MRRMRNKDATKVWHNPEIMVGSRARGPAAPRPTETAETAEDRRVAPEKRAALDDRRDGSASRSVDALCAPKNGDADKERRAAPASASNASAASSKPGRIVLPPPPDPDPRAAERQRLLAKLLRAAGRPAVSQAATEFLRAGFVFPDEQDVHLQLLEHESEDHVCTALDKLATILAAEAPQRRAVLESRLRRIEQFADEALTRAAAERLRRQVSGRAEGPPAQ